MRPDADSSAAELDNLIRLNTTVPCEDSYVCECARCELERQRRLRVGVRPVRQPWAARRAA